MRRSLKLPLLALAAGVWLISLHAMAAEGDPSKGKGVYEKNCTACHGVQGRGDGPTGKALIPPAPDFMAPAIKRKSDAELLKAIETGRPGTAMPGWKGMLSDQDIRNVLAYVRSLSK